MNVAQELFHHSQSFRVVERSPAVCRAVNNLELNRSVQLFFNIVDDFPSIRLTGSPENGK